MRIIEVATTPWNGVESYRAALLPYADIDAWLLRRRRLRLGERGALGLHRRDAIQLRLPDPQRDSR